MIQGAQSVYRTLNILKMIIQQGETTTTLKEVSEAMEITTSTAHRLLSVLNDTGFILFDPDTKTYTIGPDSVIYSGLSEEHYVRTTFGDLAGNVARLFGYTVSLFIREGDECKCVGMYKGANPIQLAAVLPAEKAPLGYGSATMGILAFLKDDEVDDILNRTLPKLQDVLLGGREKIWEYVSLSRQLGYGYAQSLLMQGGVGISYPLKDKGEVVGALAVDSVLGKEWDSKRPELVSYLKHHLS